MYGLLLPTGIVVRLSCPFHRGTTSIGDFILLMEKTVRQRGPYCAISGDWENGCGRFRSKVAKAFKRSVAVLIRKDNHILSVRRPDNDDELPGVWGLPAGSFRHAESLEDLVARIGRQKLGVVLTPIRKIAEGNQDRPGYFLQMELWEVSMDGMPNRSVFQWASMEILKPGMASGSLCCELALGLAL
jgi:8-oxo-dGTP diphosphatase